ncbi:hypothetical protein OG777_05985 [Micromonospora peucetia]|uniref:Uncharacterized protein n=1 Tax=Micromonospora peucetia TaxID=47871 RepID=A0ABZ1EII0_9ACTN|nr:hypothetical protein [Micromonospora peucetia]MCX4386478.1 hypothetical protein [Micromonospora peucetia]WSA33813.1 hypothetical protein OIE14_07125 [Micromonospora peucetia]
MDLIDVAAVTNAGLGAAFTFLFDRLANLIDRKPSEHAEPAPEVTDECNLLDSQLEPLTPRMDILEQRRPEFLALAGSLGTYHRNPERVRPDDGELIRQLSQLRALLEETYGQRITFRGEQRETTGSHVRQRSETVSGYMVGAQGRAAENADIDQEAKNIEAGGWMIGAHSDDLRPHL